MMMNNELPRLDGRLLLAASFVKGDVVADIGTDHAYIPIYLLKKGICRRAVAADINEGPLENAKKDAMLYDVKDSITFCLSDGLSNVPLSGVTDIVICGMGGELIGRILSESEYVKAPEVRLILQPMSAVEKLREYLYGKGFRITDGSVALAGGKLYQCIVCSYDGISRKLSGAQALVGAADEPLRHAELYPALLKKYILRTKKAIEGKAIGGIDAEDDKKILSELESIARTYEDR